MFSKIKLLKILLILGSLYYLVAAFAHFFGLTLFPFYDGKLYSPYHDILLALCDIIFFMIFFIVAKNPVKNVDTLNVIIIGFLFAVIFNIGIIWKIDFGSLGSIHKKFQTIIETILAGGMVILLTILKPKKN